jgi:tetrahydromethanopterin S-methyltransferase subunit G
MMRFSIFKKWKKRDENISYLQAGFARIHRECDRLEGKVDIIIGRIFKRHQYSVDELLHAEKLSKIESFSGKINDDISRWESADRLSAKIRELYNEAAETVHDRLDEINGMIHQRTPTLWDKVGAAFSRFYKAVVDLLPLIVRVFLPWQKHKFVERKGKI